MKRYLFFVLLFFAMQHLQAQTTQLSFDHLSMKEGLPAVGIEFLKQDDLGYIWIGTLDGLVRYDGYKPQIYRFGSAAAFFTVYSMVTDYDKNLWFSSYMNGLFMYDRGKDNFITYPYPKGITIIYLQTADNDGNLWGYAYGDLYPQTILIKFNKINKRFTFFKKWGSLIKSAAAGNPVWAETDKGLWKYDNKAGKFLNCPGITDTSKTIQICYEPRSEPGIFWMVTYGHSSKQLLIERLDTRDKTFKRFNHLNNPRLTVAKYSVHRIFEDKVHRLWFATQNGLMLFNKANNTFTCYLPTDTDKKANKNEIYDIAEAKDGLLWLISGKDLLSFNPFTHLFKRITANANDPDALSSDSLNNILIDKNGTLWAGNAANGVDKVNVNKSAFKFFQQNIRDGNNFHYGTTDDAVTAPDGYIYFTDGKGIYKWQPGQNKPLQIYKIERTDTYIDALTVLKNGEIYFANGRGMKIYNPANHRSQTYSTNKNDSISVSSNKINIIMQDHTGLIWVGTEDHGLCSFNPATRQFKRYAYIINNTLKESGGKLDDATIESLYEDRQGVIWIGTSTGGLNRLDRSTQKFKSYLLDGGRLVTSVGHIYEDTKGRFWISSYNDGLQEFDRKTGRYTRFLNQERGLLTREANDVKEDKKGFLWVTTPAGLTRMNPADMTFKNYPLTTILPGKSLLYDYNLLAINQQLALVMPSGFAVFNPRDLDDNPYPPQVHIEKISYSNPASTTDSITTQFRYGLNRLTLPHNQNRITFNYIALHYTDPSQNRYAFRLQGYDNHWIQAGAQRSTTYTNLAPGTYTFRVIAANSDGVWNNKGDSITLIITAPWWFTWWAWLLYVVFFVTVIYAFVVYRSRKLLYDNRILEHKIHIRTEEVLQQKEEIEAQRDNLEKAFSELKVTQNQLIQSEKMASLGELTAGIAHEIQNPLNFINNFSEVNTELIDEMHQEIDRGDYNEAKIIAEDIKSNQQKINIHGKRADFIVKGMLQHSRTSTGERQETNINVLADEFFKLSYHGLRAKDKNFNAELVTNFDENLPKVNVVQQDIGRVLLNLFNNAFYAVNQKAKTAGADYKPEVTVSTSIEKNNLIIKVRDNGNGIPDAIKDKIMQPFFTTKPTGEGTGLGLSLSYDIVVKGHGGMISLVSKEGEGAEFIITLPIS